MILDTAHTAATAYMLWDFTVAHFGNFEIYRSLPWTYSSTPIFSKLIIPSLSPFNPGLTPQLAVVSY